jgi:asparagine synthase (glutamine-hydrolysing)
MCGIFGALSSPEGQRPDVDAALRVLHHRGPDSHGIFQSDGAVLGHTRLAILDLTEGGHQPMASADGACVVVYNGEIYNHHELRRDLERRGERFRSRSDTEVIVQGYRSLGEGFLERLDGMFALAILDRVERRLVLMRDRTGKKPLFYTWESESFRFASEVRALLASGSRAKIDLEKWPLLLGLGYVPAPDTLYAGIRQLPPGSILRLDPGKEPTVRTYWKARFDGPRSSVSHEEASREIRRLLDSAVRRRMEADVPLGAFLSGGIDSTIIVGLMARASERPIKTFSIGFSGDPRFDETAYAREASRAFGTDHTEFIVEPSSFSLVDSLVEAHDGPFGDSSAIPTSIVSQLTRAHVTVALSGDGGDELFCGYPRFLAAEAADYVPSAILRLGARAARLLPESGSPRSRRRRLTRVLDTMSRRLSDRMLDWQSYFVSDLAETLQPGVSQQVNLGAARDWIAGLATDCGHASPLARALGINFMSYLPYDLLVKADRAAMLHSLELRSPFLDTALIEFVTALPDGMKRRGWKTKWILREAFQDLIPPAIRKRGKMGFGVPLAQWFRTGLRDYVRDTLAPSARLYQYVRPAAVERLLGEHEAGTQDHQHKIWLLLTVERWLQLLPGWSGPRPTTTAAGSVAALGAASFHQEPSLAPPSPVPGGVR